MRIIVKITWVKELRSVVIESLVFDTFSMKSVGDVLISIGRMLKREKEERYDIN